MFDRTFIKNKKYLTLAVHKNNILYSGDYTNDKNKEIITSLTTGEVFYNLKDFVNSILEEKTKNEWEDCLYYNYSKKRWTLVKYLLKKKK